MCVLLTPYGGAKNKNKKPYTHRASAADDDEIFEITKKYGYKVHMPAIGLPVTIQGISNIKVFEITVS
jgi:ribosomal protein S19E (S16A)